MQNKTENTKRREEKKKKKNCVRGWYYWINKEGKKEVELYVLECRVVTAVTFHLDRSRLNAEAALNAAGVNTVVDAKQNRKHKKKRRKKEEENVWEGDTIEENKEDKKEVELYVL